MWRHSVGCAIVCRHLARAVGLEDPEEVMTAGLLHDLGKAVLSYVAPDDYNDAGAIARKHRRHISEAEEAVFGITHTQAAACLIQRWSLPERLVDGIENHHRPMRSRAGKRLSAVVHVADVMTRAMGYGFAGDDTIPEVLPEAFELLGLSWDQIKGVVRHADEEYEPTVQIFAFDELDS